MVGCGYDRAVAVDAGMGVEIEVKRYGCWCYVLQWLMNTEAKIEINARVYIPVEFELNSSRILAELLKLPYFLV